MTMRDPDEGVETVQTATADAEFVAFQRAVAGEYSLERELGRGGMGIVYLARDVQLDRQVAIKVLPALLASRGDLRERFMREARTAAGLSHPNIVPIHRVGEAGEFVFFVMAYIDGESLGQRLREHGPLTPAAAAKLLREVAWALAYAHGRGVVHRDVKPDNILIERETGRALVSDFGIAQVASAATLENATGDAVTEPGQIMGTAHFMSPEQAANDPIDGRSDLYALGVVGFLALSGRLPFHAASVPALLAKQLTELPPALTEAAPAVPERLARAIDRCLRKDRDERFASGEALAEALEPANVAQRQLPTPLKVWLQAQNPLRGAYAAWSGLFGLMTAAEIVEMLTRSVRLGARDNPLVPIGFALLPVVPMVIFHLRQTYRVLRAGYSLSDLRYALTRWRAERQEELAFELEEELALPLRVLRVATYASVPAFAAWMAGCIATGVIGLNDRGVPHWASTITGVLFFSIPATFVASTALGVPLLPKRLSTAISLGALRTRFWNSRVGAWTAKLLASKRRGTPDQLVDRPTEMVLGLAASELFAALPKGYRDQLHELPAVVQRLEARATTLRKRIEETASIVARARDERPASAILPASELISTGPGVADTARNDSAAARQASAVEHLVASHEHLKRDLARTVATLESIRLDLLRVHGGANDLEPLTTLLDAAGDVERELGFLIDAQEEVRGVSAPRRDDLGGAIATPA
jgi:serine/threonine-protein kinase